GARRLVPQHGRGAQLDVRDGELLAHAPLALEREGRPDARDLEQQVDRRREQGVGDGAAQADRYTHDDGVHDDDGGRDAHGDDVHARRGDDDEQDRQNAAPGAVSTSVATGTACAPSSVCARDVAKPDPRTIPTVTRTNAANTASQATTGTVRASGAAIGT